jgi:hypothetical protein
VLVAKAQAGDPAAQARLANQLLGDKNYPEAVNWLRQAATQGEPSAEASLGNLYWSGLGVTQDYREALGWYEKAAEQGNADAQNKLGCMYRDGIVVRRDYDQAVFWFQRSAQQGNEDAHHNLWSGSAKKTKEGCRGLTVKN